MIKRIVSLEKRRLRLRGREETMKKIAILMATYNGERFLKEQLESIEKQTYPHWRLYVRDDGSSDSTLIILKNFQQKMGNHRVHIQHHHHQGCAKTFLSLVCSPSIEGDFYSYADQDDIWDEDKIERAVLTLQQFSSSGPLLYCSSSRLVNEDGFLIGHSPLYNRPPSFNHALVQNIASGNTMIFNRKSRNLLYFSSRFIFESPFELPIHDWWTYLLITAYGGHVFYDPIASLSYRQHGNNLIGYDTSLKAFFKSILRTWNGHFKKWNESHISFLHPMKDSMTSHSLDTLECFEKSRQKDVFVRIRYLIKSKVFRQRKRDTLKLYLSCLFKKI